MSRDNWLLLLGATMVTAGTSYFAIRAYNMSKTWNCLGCGKEFKTKDGYIKHCRKAHKEKIDKAYNFGYLKITILEKPERKTTRRAPRKKKAS